MKAIPYKFLLSIIAVYLLIGDISILQSQNLPLEFDNSKDQNFYSVQKAFNSYWDTVPKSNRRGWKQYKRWENFWEPRSFPNGYKPSPTELVNLSKSLKNKTMNDKLMSTKKWTPLGPFNPPTSKPDVASWGIGRINVIRLDPSNDNIIWAGAASGGVWKTTDAGKTWNTFDFTNFLSIGVSDIAVAESNPNIVYVATGDAVGCVSVSGPYYTVGLIKTTDGGKTWNNTNHVFELKSAQVITRVLVHPDNPNLVIMATGAGIYKTKDGGANWTLKSTSLYFKDLEFVPDNPNIIYASTFSWSGGASIYKSTDLGETWTKKHTVSGSNRIALTVSEAAPGYVYCICSRTSTSSFHSTLLSEDYGETFETLCIYSSYKNILGRYNGFDDDATAGQGWYDLCICASPNDENQVWIGGINLWYSDAAGSSWQKISQWTLNGDKTFVHADHHDLVYQKSTNTVFAAHDGGIDKSTNSGNNWINISNGLPITQYYSVSSSATNPNLIVLGSQDNGTSRYNNGTWEHILGGDGMACVIDPSNEQVVYASLPNGEFRKSNNSGSSFLNESMINESTTKESGAWLAPIAISQSNPKRLIVGYQNVWISNNNGSSWAKTSNFNSGTLYSLAIAPSDNNTMYAATYYKLFASYDGGANWETINVPKNAAITSITVHPTNPKRLWLTYSGYQDNLKVVEVNDGTYTNISGNLPNIPVNGLVYQTNSPDRIYIGTDVGVYTTDNNSSYWTKYGEELPNVIIRGIDIQYSSKKLRVATYGRGLWESDIDECNIKAPTITVTGNTTCCPNEIVKLEASEGYDSYLWSTGESTQIITVNKAGQYNVIGTKGNCQSVSLPITITHYDVPVMKISTSVEHPCEGDEVELNSNFGFTNYLWSTGETTRKITVNKAGVYHVKCTTSDGCVALDTINFVYSNPEKPTITYFTGNRLHASKATSYQWYFNDEIIDGATERDYIFNKIGKYHVVVTNEYDCSSSSDDYQVTSSVNEQTNNESAIKFSPNPATNFIDVEGKIDQNCAIQLSITNLLGEEVINKNYPHNSGYFSTRVDVNNLVKGTYFIVVKACGKVWKEKIAIQ